MAVLLALDAGNTNITIGAFRGGRLFRRGRLETDADSSVAQLASQLLSGSCLERVRVDAAVYASVVPTIDKKLADAVRKAFGCEAVAVTPGSPLGIRLKVKTPREVGADRILNALGAFELARGPAVVIDFGTATTFDCVSPRGDYLGGAILPGPRMAASALASRTAQLPLVEVRRPRRVIGKDTVQCIQAGLYFGYLGMIEKVLKMTLSEMGGGRVRVIATGGLSALFKADLPKGTILAPDLTLQGLRIAFERLIV